LEKTTGAVVAVCDARSEVIALLSTNISPLPRFNKAIDKAFTAAREGNSRDRRGFSQ
jgi:uncharacterized protein GlcG (DUF336 family)